MAGLLCISIWGYISLGKCAVVLAALVMWMMGRGRLGLSTGWLGVQLLTALVAECIATALSFQAENNLRVYNVYLIMECIILGCYIVPWLSLRRGTTLLLSLCLALYGIVVWVEFPVSWAERSFIANGYMVGGLLLVALSIFALFRIALRSDVPMVKEPTTWVLLGVVAFFGGTIPLLGLTNVLIDRKVTWAPNIYLISDALFFFRYGCVLVAVFIGFQRPTPMNV